MPWLEALLESEHKVGHPADSVWKWSNHFNWLAFKSYLVAAYSTGRTCLHFTCFGKVNAVNALLVLFFYQNCPNMRPFIIKQRLAWPQSYSRAPCRQRQSTYSQCYACCYACWAPHESELYTGFSADSHLSDVISSLSQHSSQFSRLKKKRQVVQPQVRGHPNPAPTLWAKLMLVTLFHRQ